MSFIEKYHLFSFYLSFCKYLFAILKIKDVICVIIKQKIIHQLNFKIMTTSKNIALALLLERAINSENVSVFAELRKPIETFARETFAFKYNSELYETEREEIKLYFSEGKDLLQKLIYFNLGIRTENPLIHYHKIEKNGEIDFTEITHDFNYADLFYWLDSERILSTVDRAIIEQAFGKHTGNDPMYFAASIGKNANEYSML